ncbi:proteolipid protein 2 [Lepisosteus oculatus]|uniref:proteolipid protein 2 n=1 Tax=Lepisosteus oculatus TaxID=7918 RepID=UPI0003EAC6D3|nr:PREDICTED: chemokine-like factor [Lepisosteus oculatus]
MEIDFTFLKSRRGILKVSEMVTVFVAFVCFATARGAPYIAATCMEFVITLALFLLFLLKLNKKITFIFWPLIDIFNSAFAALFVFILSVIALTTYSAEGALGGGIVGLIAAALWSVDAYLFFKRITFNQPRTTEVSGVK